jgi:hypothetical protein
MKKLAAILCLAALSTGAFAQGTVSILNGTSSLISYRASVGGATALLPTTANQYYFALLTAPLGVTDRAQYTFTGVIARNLASAGGIFGGAGVATTAGTWAVGVDQNYMLAGWDAANNGTTWNSAWLTGLPAAGWFGTSAVAHGVAGGAASGVTIPALNIFGGVPSLTTGFILEPVPEPTTMALVGLGAAAMLIFRRRK